jgi:hypothetical protein
MEERRAEQIAMGDRCMGFWRGMSLAVQDEIIEEVLLPCNVPYLCVVSDVGCKVSGVGCRVSC